MKLPLRQFADIVESLKRTADESDSAEHRRATRMPLSAKVQVHLTKNQLLIGQSISAILRDISMTGVGVLQSMDLAAGANAVVAMPSSDGTVYAWTVVVHSRVLADGIFFVGLQFTQIMNEEAFAQLAKDSDGETGRLKRAILD